MEPDPIERKLFGVEEARKTLPLVRAIVSDIVSHARDVNDRRLRLKSIYEQRGKPDREEDRDDPYREEVLQIEDDLRRDETKLQEFLDELHQLGVEFKDFERGLVDFPHVMDGRVVYLCWQLGEEDLGHWHEVDEGFAGRKSLLENSFSSDDHGDESTD